MIYLPELDRIISLDRVKSIEKKNRAAVVSSNDEALIIITYSNGDVMELSYGAGYEWDRETQNTPFSKRNKEFDYIKQALGL